MADEIIVETTSTEVIEVGVVGPQGPKGDKGDPGDIAGEIAWDNITGKPSTFTPTSHTHTPSEVGLGNVSNTAQVTSVTGTAPIVSSGGTTPAISITAATTSAAGSMSAADKLKLDGIAAGAEANVNADWNASSGDAQILNKPTIPSASNATPQNLAQTGSAGSSNDFARADHVHLLPTQLYDVANGEVALDLTDSEVVMRPELVEPFRSALGLGTAATADIGTGAGEVAEGNHTHTQLHDKSHTMTDVTSHTAGNHKVFYSDGSGEIVELALGNSGEVLTSNGATSAPSFAAASGGGVTGAAASASDVLGVSGSDITGVDATADRIVFWDDSASKLAYLEAGSGLSISGTTLSSPAMTGATNTAAGTAGAVPAPAAQEHNAFLNGRGQFASALFCLQTHKLDNTRFYAPIGFGGDQSVNAVGGIAGLVPIFLPNGTIDRLSIYQNSASANGTGYVALYSAKESDGKPLSVLASGDFSITNGEAAVEKAVALSPTLAVKAGLYWVGYHNSNITTNNRAVGNTNSVCSLFWGVPSDLLTIHTTYRISIATAGTWPDDPSLNVFSGANHAAVFVRMT